MSDKICPWCGVEMERTTATDGASEFLIYECPDCGAAFLPNHDSEVGE